MEPLSVVITGVSSGIGREAARRFINQGHKVTGCARRVERLEQLKDSLGDSFHGVKADLTDTSDIHELFRQAKDHFGPVDVLINNAGIGYETSLMDGDPSHWKEMIDVNVFGLALCSRLALKDMLASNSGHIFNISSMSAHRVTLGGGVYAATKYAVRALTEGLRQELSAAKSQVRVTAISPGFVETEFYQSYYHAQDQQTKDAVFDEMKALQSSDIVDAIMYSLQSPIHVGVNDILMRPLEQES